MLSVVIENSAKQSSPFGPLDNAPNGFNYPSLRHNHYWKQSMAAWSSVDAFCSSLYGLQGSRNATAYQGSATDAGACNETTSQNPVSKCEDKSTETNSCSVNENQNKLANCGPRAVDSDASMSNRSCDSKASQLMRSTSASSLVGDFTIPPSVSPSYIIPFSPMSRQTPTSGKHTGKHLSQAKTKSNMGKRSRILRKSSSAMFNSNCQRLPLAYGSSTSASFLDSSQIISQDDSSRTPQNSHILSLNSDSKQATPEVSYPSLNHTGVSHHKLDSPGKEEGRSKHKLCDVCQQPYTNHKELVLLSPSLLRQTTKTRRTGYRSKKSTPNPKFLYRRRNMNESTMSYCSLIRSNFLLTEALQTWVGRRMKREKLVKDADNDSTEDSSAETETFSESLKAKLYDLLMQIRFQMRSSDSASAKEIPVMGTDTFIRSNIVRENHREVEREVDNNDGEHLDFTNQDDKVPQTGSEENSFQEHSLTRATYGNATQPKATHDNHTLPKEYNDSSQTTFEENIPNTESISDRQEMSNTIRHTNSEMYLENVHFQDICHKPGKAYIDNRKNRRKGFQGNRYPHVKQSVKSPKHQGQFDVKNGTNEYAFQEPQRSGSRRKLIQSGNEDWEIMDERKHKFPSKEMNYVPNKNNIKDPSENVYESVETRNMVINVEEEKNPETTSHNERRLRKPQRAYNKRDSTVKKYHYRCIKIGGRERILQMEHDPNIICYFENTSKVGKAKKDNESALMTNNVSSEVPNAPMEIVDDGNIDEEVKYSKVFHKKYSGFEAAKERRIMKRIARDRMKARLETSKEREGEIGTTRFHPSWSETFVKLMKRRHKHSNKKCIIGKQAMCTDNVEESQEHAVEDTQQESAEDTQGGTAEKTQQESTEERQQETSAERHQEPAEIEQNKTDEERHQEPAEIEQNKTDEERYQEPAEIEQNKTDEERQQDAAETKHEPVEERQHETAEESTATTEAKLEDAPLPHNPPEQSSNFTGLAFLDRFFRVPMPTQMIPEKKFEIESPLNTDRLKVYPVAYFSRRSQGIQEASRETDVDEGISSKPFKGNTHMEETNSAATMRVPLSERSPVLVPTLLAPQRKLKMDNSSNSKDNQDASKTSNKPDKKSPQFTDIIHGEQKGSAATVQVQETEIPKGAIPTPPSPKRRFKIDNPSNNEKFQATRVANSKDCQGVTKTPEKPESGEEIQFSNFKNDMRVKQMDSSTTMDVPWYETPSFLSPTHLSPKRRFKIDCPYNLKNSKTGKGSKDVFDLSKTYEKGQEMTFPNFNDKVLAEQTGKDIIQQTVETETSEVQAPTQVSPKRKFVIVSEPYNAKLKASGAAYFSKESHDVSKTSYKSALDEDIKALHLKDLTHVREGKGEATLQEPGSNIVQETSHVTPKRQYKWESLSHFKKLQASIEAHISKARSVMKEKPKKMNIAEEVTSSQPEDNILAEQNDRDITRKAGDFALIKSAGSEMHKDVQNQERHLADRVGQKVQAGKRAEWDTSASQENMFKQIYSKLLEPVGSKIVDDLEQFGHSNRPLKYRIPASQRLYSPPGSRPVYMSEFLTWLGVRQTDHSSSDDEEDAADPDNHPERSRRQQTFPGNVQIASSMNYFKTQNFERFEEQGNATLIPSAERTFVSQESQQMYLHGKASEDISAFDAMDTNTTSRLANNTPQTLSERKDSANADFSKLITDKAAPDKSLSPVLESTEIPSCESPSKVFHKKYSMKEKMRENEMLRDQLQLPWRKKDRVADEGLSVQDCEGKTITPTRTVFTKQAEKTRQREKREEELYRLQELCSQKRYITKGDSHTEQVFSADKKDLEDQMEVDAHPCRVCLSSREFQERSLRKERDEVQPSQPSKHAHQNLDDHDVTHGTGAKLQVEQGELQQSASESYSVMDAINQLLREIPTDVMRKKFLDDIVSFAEANIPLKFKIPPVSEVLPAKHAAPIYLSQILSLVKTETSQRPHRRHTDSSSDEVHSSIDRIAQPDPLPKNVRRAGSLSHMMSRRPDPPMGTSGRHFFLSAPAREVSLRDLTNVSNIQHPDDMGESISYAVSEASETVTESNAPDISQVEPPPIAPDAAKIDQVEPPPIAPDAAKIYHVEPLPIAPDVPEISKVEPPPIVLDTPESSQLESPAIAAEGHNDPVESPCKVFHKRFSTEGKCREKEILGTWGENPLKKRSAEESTRRCRDPPVAEVIPPKKNVFSKQAERTLERERQDKEFEKEYAEFFGDFHCPSLKGRDEAAADENGKDVPGVNGGGMDNDVVVADDAAAVLTADVTTAAIVTDGTTAGVPSDVTTATTADPTTPATTADAETAATADAETSAIADATTAATADAATADAETAATADAETAAIADATTAATADDAAAVKIMAEENLLLAKGNISEAVGYGQQESADRKTSKKEEIQTEVMSDVNTGDIPSGISRLLQGTVDNLFGQKFLGDQDTTGVRSSPTRYSIPYSCEMFQPPEARPIYMARDTSDRILSFLGLRQKTEPDETFEPKSYTRKAKSSISKYGLGHQDGMQATSPPWGSDTLNFDSYLPQFQSRFLRKELASTSTYKEYERKQFYDFRSFEDRNMLDGSARDYQGTHSLKGRIETAKSQYDSTQRSPKGTEAAHREYINTNFDKYIGFQSRKMKRAGLEKVKDGDWQKEDHRRSKSSDLFRWIGKTRTDNFRLQKSLVGDSEYVEDVMAESEDVIQEGAEEATQELAEEAIYEQTQEVILRPIEGVIRGPADDMILGPTDDMILGPTDDVILGPTDDEILGPADDVIRGPTEGVISEEGTDVIQEFKESVDQDLALEPEVYREDKIDQRTGPYFKGTFPEAFEESTIGAITLRVLDEIVAYGQRNVPLKFQTRRQEFLQMPAAAQPMYISRKNWDQAMGYLGLSGGEEEEVEEEESPEPESSSSSEEEVPPSVEPVVVPREETPVEKVVREEIESPPEEEIPRCVLRGGVVESHRELTFYCPTVPLPRRFRGVTRRNRYEYNERTPSVFLRHRSRSQSRMSSYRRESICYGRTKQLKGRCDIWAKSELDRSSHFSQSGRYYRKHLFRKRLTLRNILRECEKSKEWRKLENSFKNEHTNKEQYSYDNKPYGAEKKIGELIRDAARKSGVARLKDDNISDDMSSSQNCAAHSQRFDFLVSPPRSKGYYYNPERCSNCGEGKFRAFSHRRMVLDIRPEGQGDNTNHIVNALRNRCSTGYGYSLAPVRNDAEAMYYGKTTEGAHELLCGYSQYKSRPPGLPSFGNTTASFGKRGTHRNIVASKRKLVGQENHPWVDTLPNWRGCHNNALPIATASTDVKLGRGSYFDVGKPQVVKPLGHQPNMYAYRDVKTQFPYTSNYYNDDGCNLCTLTHSSSILLPTRIY